MATPRIRALTLALAFLLSLGLSASSPLWATQRHEDLDNSGEENVVHYITWADAQRLQWRLPSLLPVARLRNESAAHYLHVKQTLKWATSLPITQFSMAPGAVNFRPGWHPKPYTTGAEDLGAFQLGLLASYGHFAMVNANIPEMKEYATTILGELDTITSSTMLSDMNGDIKQVAQAVADPTYPGGPTKALEQFDRWTIALSQRIKTMYFLDGFWYYCAGIDLGGLNCIPQTDSFNAPYFRNYLQALYNNVPSTGIPYGARYEMATILRTHSFIGWNWGNNMERAQRAIQDILAAGPGPVIIRQP
jgi:hypothetical protein